MRSLHRLLAISILSLPLIAAMPALADNSLGNENQNIILAPEIDPDLLGGVVALLAGGLLILRERRRA